MYAYNTTSEITIRLFYTQPFYRILGEIYNHTYRKKSQLEHRVNLQYRCKKERKQFAN